MLPPRSVLYIGCVGRDRYADILASACRDAGLRTEYRVDDAQPTGRCGVIITGHDRSMCTHLAAANEYKLDHLRSPPVWDAVQKARVYYVGGYHLTVCVPAVMALAEEAAGRDKVRPGSFFTPVGASVLSVRLPPRVPRNPEKTSPEQTDLRSHLPPRPV